MLLIALDEQTHRPLAYFMIGKDLKTNAGKQIEIKENLFVKFDSLGNPIAPEGVNLYMAKTMHVYGIPSTSFENNNVQSHGDMVADVFHVTYSINADGMIYLKTITPVNFKEINPNIHELLTELHGKTIDYALSVIEENENIGYEFE